MTLLYPRHTGFSGGGQINSAPSNLISSYAFTFRLCIHLFSDEFNQISDDVIICPHLVRMGPVRWGFAPEILVSFCIFVIHIYFFVIFKRMDHIFYDVAIPTSHGVLRGWSDRFSPK